MLNVFVRPQISKVTGPIADLLIKVGLTPNAVTVIGTVLSVLAALTLFPSGQLFWGTMALWLFTMFDMLDGAMARSRGGGTKFGAVLDASCDRIADGVIFGSLVWWATFHGASPQRALIVGLLVCLVTSQVISYIKARAEASGLSADGGLIERPERLIIILVGAGFTGLGVDWAIHIATWLLAAGSLWTVGQRMYAVATSPGAHEKIALP